jgi:H+/Cl- antiporter ClcA
MTVTKENSKPKDVTFQYGRVLYGAFVLLSIYFLATKQIESAMSNLGIALIFDPFDQKVTWNDRPVFQQIWLIVHASIVFGLLGIMLFNWLVG